MAKILVADDSPTEILHIKNILAELKHDLTVATDGEEAEKIIKAGKFDLVILDVVMPKKNGFQLCREIKKDDATKDTPVILITSKDQPTDKMWGLKQGANEYLTKPYEPGDLLKTVKKYLG